jgi:hypothetical protein
MIVLSEKEIAKLGIKTIEFDNYGRIKNIVGFTKRIDKIYQWKVLDLEYFGG